MARRFLKNSVEKNLNQDENVKSFSELKLSYACERMNNQHDDENSTEGASPTSLLIITRSFCAIR